MDLTLDNPATVAAPFGDRFAHGASLRDVMHIRTFMTNLHDRAEYGAVRRRFFPMTPPPASTTVEVTRLFLPGAVLEVEVTAIVPAGDRGRG